MKTQNIGLLILRVGIGIMFILHGYPKIIAGPEMWGKLGQSMALLGVTYQPQFWGCMAAVSEFFGGICLVTGLFFRPLCSLLTFTMFVATMLLFHQGQGFNAASHPLEDAIVFVSLLIIGPGTYTMQNGIKKVLKKS
jgi:putative oxidoreductase